MQTDMKNTYLVLNTLTAQLLLIESQLSRGDLDRAKRNIKNALHAARTKRNYYRKKLKAEGEIDHHVDIQF